MTDTRTIWPGWLGAALAGFAILAWLTLMAFARDATFRGDDWDFVAGRSLSDPLALLRPFNEQWVTGGAIVFRLLFAVIGMHSYLPYLAVLLAIHLVMAAGVARLIEKTSGLVPAIVAGAVVALLGVGNENLTQAFQIGMVLSAALGFWAIAALWIAQRPALAALLLTAAVASHAVSLVFIGACIVLCLSPSRDRVRTLSWFTLPVVALIAWTFLFDLPHIAGRGGAFVSSVASVPAFMAAGGLTAVGATFGLAPQAGVLVLAALVAMAVRAARRPAHPDLALAGFAAIALLYGLVAVSRGQLGVGAVLWSRYLYVGVPLALIVVAAWFGSPGRLPERRRHNVTVALVGLGAVAILGNLRFYVLERAPLLEGYQAERAALAILESRADARRPSFDIHMPPPAEVRSLIAAYGNPARDDLVPAVVPPVSESIALTVCNEMVQAAEMPACLKTVASAVGRQ